MKSPTTETTNSPTQKFLTVKEWEVKFSYEGDTTLIYSFDSNVQNGVNVTTSMLATFKGCEYRGAGYITRAVASENYPVDTTVGQAYSQSPGTIGKVGNYHYYYNHPQASCAETYTDVVGAVLSESNSLLKSAVPKAEAN